MATDKKKFDRNIARGLRNFAKQEGEPHAFTIVPVSCMESMMKAARDGDVEARSSLIAFTNWCSCVANGNAKPLCVGCLKEVRSVPDGGDGIGGWAQILPVGDGTALVAPICIQCIKRDHQELSAQVFDALEEEVGVRAMTVQ